MKVLHFDQLFNQQLSSVDTNWRVLQLFSWLVIAKINSQLKDVFQKGTQTFGRIMGGGMCKPKDIWAKTKRSVLWCNPIESRQKYKWLQLSLNNGQATVYGRSCWFANWEFEWTVWKCRPLFSLSFQINEVPHLPSWVLCQRLHVPSTPNRYGAVCLTHPVALKLYRHQVVSVFVIRSYLKLWSLV